MGILGWELLIISLLYRQLESMVQTLFLDVYLIMLHANKLSEHIRT